MVTNSEFEEVGRILSSRVIGKRNHTKTIEFIYKPLLVCGYCSGTITAERKSKKLKSGKVIDYTYYHCTRNKKEIACKEKSVTENQITEELKTILKSVVIHPILKTWAMTHLESEIRAKKEQNKSINVSKQSTIEKLVIEKQALTRKFAVGTIADDDYREIIKTINAEINLLKPKIKDNSQSINQDIEKVSKVLSIITKSETILEKGSLHEKRELIRLTASNFFIKGKKPYLKPHKWMLSLNSFVNDYTHKIASFEPLENGSETDYCTNLVGLRSIWLGIIDDIRKTIL